MYIETVLLEADVYVNKCGTMWEKGGVIACYFRRTFVNLRNIDGSI